MAGPFAGLLVVEIGQFVVAPVAAMQLAHGGARVIKVEPAEGDYYRGASPVIENESRHFIVKNRGKESVSLRIGAEGVDGILNRLFASADVVLTNMSPSALDRHGLDYESVKSVNPNVVYGAVTGFGYVGPEASLPGMDVVAQARSGLLLALGAETGGVPVHSEVQAVDYATSLLLFAGVSTALFARERTGKGQKVEVSLLAAALFLQGNSLHHLFDFDQWREEFVGEVLPRLRREGHSQAEIAVSRNELRPDSGIKRDAYRVVPTSDGYVAVAAGSSSSRRRLFEILRVTDDGDLATESDRTVQVDRAFAAQSTKHWMKELSSAGIPVSDLHHIEEMLFDEHVLAEGLVVDVDHELIGRYRTFGAPIRLSGTPFAAGAPSPPFARHTRSVLAEFGYTEKEINKLIANGAAIEESR